MSLQVHSENRGSGDYPRLPGIAAAVLPRPSDHSRSDGCVHDHFVDGGEQSDDVHLHDDALLRGRSGDQPVLQVHSEDEGPGVLERVRFESILPFERGHARRYGATDHAVDSWGALKAQSGGRAKFDMNRMC